MASQQPPPRDGRRRGDRAGDPGADDAGTGGADDTNDVGPAAEAGTGEPDAPQRADGAESADEPQGAERPEASEGVERTAAPEPAELPEPAEPAEPGGRGEGPKRSNGGPARPSARPKGGAAKAGRRLSVAVGVGVGLGGLVLLSLYLVRWVFLVLLVLFVGVAVGELARALAVRGVRVPVPPVALGLLVTVLAAWSWGTRGLVSAFAFTALAVMVWRLPDGIHGYVRDMTAGVFAAAYLPFLAGFAVLLLVPDDGADRVVTFIAVTIASDIGGYFAGAFLGRHRMTPAISPKKTWEGLAGSVAGCMLVGAVLLPYLFGGYWWQGVVLGVAAAASATFGDLTVSMVKRDLGIKDMGGLIPEHGGVLDRLDSLLATAPVVWLLLTWFVGTA